jgi:thymidylate synthase (FAD)
MDSLFEVVTLRATPMPQQLVWQAMHQDYSEEAVAHEMPPPESKAGDIVVKRLLAGERGHYGPLEHPQISFATAGFPHSVMQQARTHRVGVSFDVQSGRYTGQRVIDAVSGKRSLEEVFYLRPPGEYRDRQGKHYRYSEDQRVEDLLICAQAASRYAARLEEGFAEEHMRGVLPFDIRQNFVVSFSLRAALHFMDLRAKLDAQDEIRALCELMEPHLEKWVPQIWDWYRGNRLHRARLAP